MPVVFDSILVLWAIQPLVAGHPGSVCMGSLSWHWSQAEPVIATIFRVRQDTAKVGMSEVLCVARRGNAGESVANVHSELPHSTKKVRRLARVQTRLNLA